MKITVTLTTPEGYDRDSQVPGWVSMHVTDMAGKGYCDSLTFQVDDGPVEELTQSVAERRAMERRAQEAWWERNLTRATKTLKSLQKKFPKGAATLNTHDGQGLPTLDLSAGGAVVTFPAGSRFQMTWPGVQGMDYCHNPEEVVELWELGPEEAVKRQAERDAKRSHYAERQKVARMPRRRLGLLS